ncbi:MAG: beta-ketoacyl synthase N-terminal-like domain-containing protein [Syntrophomonas sp.]
MQAKKRIVINGLGTINAVAHNITDIVSALLAGVCGIGPLDLFDTDGFRCHNGGQIKNFNPRNHIPQNFPLKTMSRADMLSFAATLEALTDAGLYPLPQQLAEETGIVIGGGSGGLLEAEFFYRHLLKNNDKHGARETPLSI